MDTTQKTIRSPYKLAYNADESNSILYTKIKNFRDIVTTQASQTYNNLPTSDKKKTTIRTSMPQKHSSNSNKRHKKISNRNTPLNKTANTSQVNLQEPLNPRQSCSPNRSRHNDSSYLSSNFNNFKTNTIVKDGGN